MTLMMLINELQSIAVKQNAEEIEVYEGDWDDGVYDGNKIEGIRLVKEIDCEKNEKKMKLFLTHS